MVRTPIIAAISQLRGTLTASLGVLLAGWHALYRTIVGRPPVIKDFGYEGARRGVSLALMRLGRRSATRIGPRR
jgi:hypothetical protein